MIRPRREPAPSWPVAEVTRDGREFLLRPVEPDDKQQLADGLARMGEESRYRRFLSPKHRFTSAELSYLTEVDHHDHEALIALDAGTRAGVGVARYVRWPGEPAVAEPAVAVVDDWQHAGVGKALLARLAERATDEGIGTFRAVVLRDNGAVLGLLGGASPRVASAGPGLVEVEFELTPEPRGASEKLFRALRAAARGQITFRLRRA